VVNMALRIAVREDSRFLFETRNSPEVRAVSKNQEVILQTTHEGWFNAQLNSADSVIWILESQGQREGYIRARKIEENTWLLSIALQAPFRGRGHGSWAVREACRMLVDTHVARCIVAEPLTTNMTVCRLFEGKGFVNKGIRQIGEHKVFRFESLASI
jgi:RimJ/RimL family protein N-acetyltransferase